MVDYWDLDSILAEEHPVTAKFQTEAPGAGWLDPHLKEQGVMDVRESVNIARPFTFLAPSWFKSRLAILAR